MDFAFKDMGMLGKSLKCNSNEFLKSHFKDAAYDSCVKNFNHYLEMVLLWPCTLALEVANPLEHQNQSRKLESG